MLKSTTGLVHLSSPREGKKMETDSLLLEASQLKTD